MWYENCFRRHLCDMHIHEWDDSFLSKFSPEEYVENLKKAKIQNAMIYFQSHIGLCYYPTKTGKIHNAFVGREDAMHRLVELCHEAGISVTGYYSLIYNTWAHDEYPQWRLVGENGKSRRESTTIAVEMEFSDDSKAARYGLCCPNNPQYKEFVVSQIKEMADYFSVEGMFYDMLFWSHFCYCDHCKKRWAEEVGGEIPTVEDWQDKRWLMHMQKRREWMGEFAHWVTDLTRELMPGVSVEHNLACSALPNGKSCNAEEVITACDYAGGDLYRDPYSQSFACKFYRAVSKNQPFEYMFSRCSPNLAAHTQIKSRDVMRSSVFLTAANHGATLVIDAIDPVGTMDSRVYGQIGEVFDELIPYEKYMSGNPLEDIGLYYTLKGKFNPRNELYTNYTGIETLTENLIANNIMFGVTGGFGELDKYKAIVAPALTCEDEYDNKRIADYVKNGGLLYFSGGDNSGLIKEFFGADVTGQTIEKVVYISPLDKYQQCFDYFDGEHPINFDGTAPIVEGINPDSVIAKITLPYTNQSTTEFVSIHSNPPGIKTDIPAMAMTKYGNGVVLWSAVSIESIKLYDHKRIFLNLLRSALGFVSTVVSDAPKDVEITAFEAQDHLLINTVLLNDDYKARKVEDFYISIKSEKQPKTVTILPNCEELSFTYENGAITFESKDLDVFKMYKIQF